MASTPRRRRAQITPLEYTRRRWLQIVLLANFFFLYFPIVALVAFSFNDSKRNITWQGFTLKYYRQAYENAALHEAFTNSMIIAATSTLVSTALGTMSHAALMSTLSIRARSRTWHRNSCTTRWRRSCRSARWRYRRWYPAT